ncbi:MAG: hypothetical protein ABEJ61_06150 [Haloferacaceae archaeon]
MEPLQFLVPVGRLEAVAGVIPYAVLALVLANIVTRKLAHDTYARQAAEGGDEAISRYLPHSVVSILLVLVSFAYLVVAPHAGMVMSVLVVGMVVADFFEFEARQVEARNDMPIEAPKSSIAAAVLVLLYAAYQSLFFLVQPYWTQIV